MPIALQTEVIVAGMWHDASHTFYIIFPNVRNTDDTATVTFTPNTELFGHTLSEMSASDNYKYITNIHSYSDFTIHVICTLN